MRLVLPPGNFLAGGRGRPEIPPADGFHMARREAELALPPAAFMVMCLTVGQKYPFCAYARLAGVGYDPLSQGFRITV